MKKVYKNSVLRLAGPWEARMTARGGEVGANIVYGGMLCPGGGTCWGGTEANESYP
jgi:hypothetical protein